MPAGFLKKYPIKDKSDENMGKMSPYFCVKKV